MIIYRIVMSEMVGVLSNPSISSALCLSLGSIPLPFPFTGWLGDMDACDKHKHNKVGMSCRLCGLKPKAPPLAGMIELFLCCSHR